MFTLIYDDENTCFHYYYYYYLCFSVLSKLSLKIVLMA